MTQWFSNTRTRRKDELITIRRNQSIGFNVAFCEEYLPNKPEYMLISNPEKSGECIKVSFVFGDKETFEKLGLQPFSVDWSSKSHRTTVSVANWFKGNKLDAEQLAMNYTPIIEEDSTFGKKYSINLPQSEK